MCGCYIKVSEVRLARVMQSCNLLLVIQKKKKIKITPVLHFKSLQHICAFYFSAAEGDDLSCHVVKQFNNGFIIIFQKTQKNIPDWVCKVLLCLSLLCVAQRR